MKTRPCSRLITVGDEHVPCPYPAMKRKQACEWHWLLRQSSDVQAEHAQRRLAATMRAAGDFVGGYEMRARVPASEWPDGERWCAGCQSFVPLFYCSGSRCRACASRAAHARRVEAVYGITADEYDRLYRLQGGRCAICRNQSRTIRFAVDHDHQTGDVRGLLCKRCNHDLLGGGHDSIDLLWRAIGYLLYPPAQRLSTQDLSDEVVLRALEGYLSHRRAITQRPSAEPVEPPF